MRKSNVLKKKQLLPLLFDVPESIEEDINLTSQETIQHSDSHLINKQHPTIYSSVPDVENLDQIKSQREFNDTVDNKNEIKKDRSFKSMNDIPKKVGVIDNHHDHPNQKKAKSINVIGSKMNEISTMNGIKNDSNVTVPVSGNIHSTNVSTNHQTHPTTQPIQVSTNLKTNTTLPSKDIQNQDSNMIKSNQKRSSIKGHGIHSKHRLDEKYYRLKKLEIVSDYLTSNYNSLKLKDKLLLSRIGTRITTSNECYPGGKWDALLNVNQSELMMEELKRQEISEFKDTSTQVEEGTMVNLTSVDLLYQELKDDLDITQEMTNFSQKQQLKNNIGKAYKQILTTLSKLETHMIDSITEERMNCNKDLIVATTQLDLDHQDYMNQLEMKTRNEFDFELKFKDQQIIEIMKTLRLQDEQLERQKFKIMKFISIFKKIKVSPELTFHQSIEDDKNYITDILRYHQTILDDINIDIGRLHHELGELDGNDNQYLDINFHLKNVDDHTSSIKSSMTSMMDLQTFPDMSIEMLVPMLEPEEISEEDIAANNQIKLMKEFYDQELKLLRDHREKVSSKWVEKIQIAMKLQSKTGSKSILKRQSRLLEMVQCCERKKPQQIDQSCQTDLNYTIMDRFIDQNLDSQTPRNSSTHKVKKSTSIPASISNQLRDSTSRHQSKGRKQSVALPTLNEKKEKKT
ncbi:hypothetical protein HDV02_001220 [Globomyces sp. JEL0801]|nr:hypothetical protein HDV02_001220 [Globomyces sp. JEL0801]